ncbi:MAG: alpha/beta hydrolase [Opitutales bacterium]|nr:alpha/beta hydrolase [Opitutales bacterium]
MDILNHPLIAERYFFPRPHPVPEAVVIDTPGGPLLAHHRIFNPDWPTLVHFHGNGEAVANYCPGTVERWGGLGVNLFFAEYRGYGGSAGRPLLGQMLDDVAAYRESLGIPDSRIIVYGRSVGSLFALEWVDRFPETGGLILDSAVADVQERLRMRIDPRELGVSGEAFAAACSARLDHQKKLSGYRFPVLILHARRDHLVDASHAERLRQWCVSPDSRLILFARGDHNSVYWENQDRFENSLRGYIAMERAWTPLE